MKELLTTREVQDRLKVDRTTVYRMLKDGRLAGVKVGQQWRFERTSVDALLAGGCEREARLPSRPADVLPLHCVQPIQDVFAEVAGVSAITVTPDGDLLTRPSGGCRFCALIQTHPAGRQACQESWRRLATAPAGSFSTCHAGLHYVHAPIRVDGTSVALIIAGQCHVTARDGDALATRLDQLSAAYGLERAELAEAASAIPTLDSRAHAQLASWLGRVAATFETIAHERAALLDRLRRIAEMTILEEV